MEYFLFIWNIFVAYFSKLAENAFSIFFTVAEFLSLQVYHTVPWRETSFMNGIESLAETPCIKISISLDFVLVEKTDVMFPVGSENCWYLVSVLAEALLSKM